VNSRESSLKQFKFIIIFVAYSVISFSS